MTKIAAVRIRGRFNIRGEVEDTLDMLGLKSNNSCIIIEDTPNNMGMIKKVKDYITYGEISEDTLKALLKKKAPSKKTDAKIVFNLPNPKKGFTDIKRGFNQKGDLGYRGDKINEFLGRVVENI
ncbi:MAG: uL30 family ribosomal protein [Candidatus Aenigmatarchaeota archaeon]